jgi:hypothetical protein
MADERKDTQAMPKDGLKGAPDGVNSQAHYGENEGAGGSTAYPNPHTGKEDAEKDKPGFGTTTGHGGQSKMGYHGSGQLGDKEVEPGGNRNAGSKSD